MKASEPSRAEGKLKLWRTQIDLDADGKTETIVRLENPFTARVWQGEKSWEIEEHPCTYRDGRLYMLESPSNTLKTRFNGRAPDVADILHFSGRRVFPGETNGYYGVSRLTTPAYPDGDRIGATRGMFIYQLNNWGAEKCAASTGSRRVPSARSQIRDHPVNMCCV
jgi:hypothetical protein